MDELQKTSEEISRFLKFLEQTEQDYVWAAENMNRAEGLTQDLLHQLELQPSTYHSRANLAKRLKECRVQRRKMKDMFVVYGPVVELLRNEKGKLMVSQLQQVLGKVRKHERYLEERRYTPKVMKPEEFGTVE